VNTLKCFDFEDDFICAAESLEQALAIQAETNGKGHNVNGEYNPEELNDEQMKAMPCYIDEAHTKEGNAFKMYFWLLRLLVLFCTMTFQCLTNCNKRKRPLDSVQGNVAKDLINYSDWLGRFPLLNC